MDTYAYWGPFDLTEGIEAECVFWYLNDTDIIFDYLLWGAIWNDELYEGGRESGPTDWIWDPMTIDFSELISPSGDTVSLLGEEQVYVVFYFHSDNIQLNHWGSFIDHISLGYNDGLPDLHPLTAHFLHIEGEDTTETYIPVENTEYIIRLTWEAEAYEPLHEFEITCTIDDEEFFSTTTSLNIFGDTTLYTYTDQTYIGDLGSHTMEWFVDSEDQVLEGYEDNNIYFFPFEVVMFDSLPSITVLTPVEGDSSDLGFWVKWDAYDRESNAKIYLYFDTDSSGYNGTALTTSPIYEDDPDSLWWNTSTLVEGAEYYVYAKIYDYFNPFVYDYSEGSVVIHHPTVSVDPSGDIAAEFRLLPNYPNPFNSSTTINYIVPEKSTASIEIFDVSGRLVETLLSSEVNPGQHHVVWNTDVTSGVYMCRVTLRGINSGKVFEGSQKLIYVR